MVTLRNHGRVSNTCSSGGLASAAVVRPLRSRGLDRLPCHYGIVWWSRNSAAVLITSAPRTPNQEFSQRKRRYTVMMGLRIVFLFGALFTYSVSLWLALLLVAAGAVLPWCAVLIANDGPPRKRRPVRPLVTPDRDLQLPSPGDRTIDG